MIGNRFPPPTTLVHRAGEYILAFEAMAMLGAARLLIARAPFRRVMQRVSRQSGQLSIAEDRLPNVLRAIDRAARRAPFRAKCFEQALAGHWMLGRRGIATRLHYGIGAGGADNLRAHVWLSCGPDIVLGQDGRQAFAEVGVWPTDRPPDRA